MQTNQFRARAAVMILALLTACGGGGGGGGGSEGPKPGDLVSEFGNGGVVISNPGTDPGDSDGIQGAAISAGMLYIVGFETLSGVPDTQWRIEKRNAATGALIDGFGTAGAVSSDPGAFTDMPMDIVVDEAGGSMFVAGYGTISGSDTQWRIEKRSLADGSMIAAFGNGGAMEVNPSANLDDARALALDATGLYVVGTDRSNGASNAQWRIEKRDLTTGSLVAAFGTAGVALSNPSPGEDYPNVALLDGGSLFVGGSDSVPGNLQARIEKRSATDSGLDAGFGSAGVMSFQDHKVYGLQSDGTALYAFLTTNYSNLKLRKMDLVDGQAISGFGTNGALNLTFGFPSNVDPARLAFVLAGSTLYVGGSSNSVLLHVEAHDASTGALVADFGNGGAVTSDPSPSYDRALHLQADESALYIFSYSGDINIPDFAWYIEKRNR